MRKNKKTILLALTLCCLFTSGAMAADSGSGEAEMRAALAEINQAEFDQYFVKLRDDAYMYIGNNLVVEKSELINMIQISIAEQYQLGNREAVKSLQSMLDYIENESGTFAETYEALVPYSVENQEADEAALQNVMNDYANALAQVQQDVNAYDESLLTEKNALIKQLKEQSWQAQQKERYMPNVPDGTIASVFYIENGGYYVDAGLYAEAHEGMQCPVVDQETGEYIGNLELIYCFPKFSVGVLVHSIDITQGAKVPNLTTQKEEKLENER